MRPCESWEAFGSLSKHDKEPLAEFQESEGQSEVCFQKLATDLWGGVDIDLGGACRTHCEFEGPAGCRPGGAAEVQALKLRDGQGGLGSVIGSIEDRGGNCPLMGCRDLIRRNEGQVQDS